MIDLGEIRKGIGGPSEDGRYAAWMSLYSSTEAEAASEIRRVLEGKDPILKILFIRFLSHVHEAKSVAYLCELLADENAVVVEGAKKAFEISHCGLKLQILLPLLDSPVRGARFFAMEKLALGGVEQIVGLLLPRIPAADEETLCRILAALRHFPKRPILDVILPYLEDGREEVRFRTVLVLGSCYEAGFAVLRKPLTKALGDESPRIRQAVLWSLRRHPSPKDIELLIACSKSDPDSFVRQESLVEMAHFPTVPVIRHLLTLIVFEKDRLVALKAEGVLMNMSRSELVNGLKDLLQDPEIKVKNKALILFAEFERDSHRYYERIVTGFEQVTEDKDKLPFIEAFGILEDERAVPLLEGLLHGSPVIAYTAILSLLKILRKKKDPPFLTYLEDDRLSPMYRQMVLKAMVRRGGSVPLTERQRTVLERYLHSETINQRYLAAQVLLRDGGEASMVPFVETLLKEKDPTSVKHLTDGLRNLLGGKPTLSVELLSKFSNNRVAVMLLLSLLETAATPAHEFISLLPRFVGEPLRILQTEGQSGFADLLASLLRRRRIELEKFLDAAISLPEKGLLLRLVTERLAKISGFEAVLPLSTVRKWMDTEDPAQKRTMIDLMGVCRDRAVISELVAIACDPSLEAYHPRAVAALNKSLQKTPGVAA